MKKSQNLQATKEEFQEAQIEEKYKKAKAEKDIQKANANYYLSEYGYQSINEIKFSLYSLKDLEETISDCIKFTLLNKTSEGIKEYLEYIHLQLSCSVPIDISNIVLNYKYVAFDEWLRDQIGYIESGGAIDYAVFLSKDQNNTKYSSFLEIIMEIEKTMELEENSLLPLIRLLKDLKVRVNNNSIKLWKIFVVIDIACSKGFILHKEYSASNDRKSKDNVVRDLLCGEVYLNGNEISSKNVSDSVRQSRKEYGSSRNTSSNYYDFSIKIEAIFDKWTFR